MYTAYLKRPVSERHESKQKAVDELLEQLGLSACKSVRIGNPLQKGISGGQVSDASWDYMIGSLTVRGCRFMMDGLFEDD